MNIIFIDYEDSFSNNKEKYSSKLFGMYIRKINNKLIYYIAINRKKYSSKMLCLFLRQKAKNEKLYMMFGKEADKDKSLKEKIQNYSKNIKIITEQNNLIQNDKKYLKKYIDSNNLKIEKVKILIITDRIDNVVQEKIRENIEKFKNVDILTIGKSVYFDTKDFIERINKEFGSTIEVLDKMPKVNYNIVLVFSKEGNVVPNNSSFILDYNNSELDVESNTYKVYLKNKENITDIFNKLNINISKFNKTKLGKLYIHKEWNTLDR